MLAYVQLQKKFPQSEVGRVRLELLLSKLQSEKDALRDVDALREPLTEAAKLDVVSAMEILGNSLRKRDPKGSFNWLCAAAARGRAHSMAEVGLRYSNGAGVERDLVKAAQWFEQARSAGDRRRHIARRVLPLRQRGEQERDEAVVLLQEASLKDPPRWISWALFIPRASASGRPREAFRLYNEAAKLNYLASTGNLGVLYLASDERDLGEI